MVDGRNIRDVDFTIDKGNLYREQVITDHKVATIRRLVPVKSDGTNDTGRKPIFYGNTQLMTTEGPLPLQARLKAGSYEEAIEEFPGAMKKALDDTIAQIQKFQEQQQQQQGPGGQQESRIWTPK